MGDRCRLARVLSIVGQILLYSLAFAGVLWIYDILTRRLTYRPRPDEVHYVTTSDGWRLAVARFAPEAPAPDRLPVIVCPGIGVNGAMFDYPGEGDDIPLIRWLNQRGWDVWLAEVRGVGGSRHQPDGAPSDWTFDTLGEIDVPAIIDTVCERTNSPAACWIGHSLGGMMLVHQMARHNPRLAAAVWVGSAVTFEHQPLLANARRAGRLFGFRRLAVKGLSRWLAPAGSVLVTWPSTLFFRPQNVRAPLRRALLASIVEPIASGLMKQLALGTERKHLVSADGQRDLVAPLRDNRTPVLLVAGSDDRIAPVAAVQHTFEHIGGPASLIVVGKDTGASVDYGHGDLLMGETSATEIYPKIDAWLCQHAACEQE
ncbi:MAG: putative alpha/beta hydrolase [Myxococcota bacterium]|jgi:predicted alpha/beta hydrolase